jgi:hypothetical protein
MQTYTGRAYWPLDPRPEDVTVEDIAHSLSMQCRYGGHSKLFYSVAEHSALVSQLVPPEHALVALMHDATEAYVIDVPRPLKAMLPDHARLEELSWRAIAERFGLPAELPACVRKADNDILLAEGRALMHDAPMPRGIEGEVTKVQIMCLPPFLAKELFLNRFADLYRG